MLECNDPKLKSWIEVSPTSDFPIQNLPFGIFRTSTLDARAGVAIGENVIDLLALANHGFFKSIDAPLAHAFAEPVLNDFMALGKPVWRAVRGRVSELLRTDCPILRDNTEARGKVLLKQADVEMCLPVRVGNYVDFYSSLEHATNVGSMFRDPTNPLLPNWKHIPIGYNGRASSVIVSGQNFCRPKGQTKADADPAPEFGPSRQLDFELEIGVITGRATALGESLTPAQVDDMVFGLTLLNDWSARDIQRWEYVPLGPFLGKTFATSLSPWIVTLDALEPLRVPTPTPDIPLLPYLQCDLPSNFDINLEVSLIGKGLTEEQKICQTNYKAMYFSANQQIAHQTSNGTNLCIGDIYGSGTISGTTPDSYGSMLELCWKGTKPITLADGSKRAFIQDGDTVIMRGHGVRAGVRIGFGDVRATVLPAR